MEAFDIVVVGGGIVGLAAARALRQSQPKLSLAIVEKESAVGLHQTGHNSGVIHSGIYYRPGSFKAELCVRGAKQMVAYCDQYGIPYRHCGKVIIATEPAELEGLELLLRRGIANGVPGLRKIGADELKALEPYAYGLAALHSPRTGIVDYGAVAESLAAQLTERGAAIYLGARVQGIYSDGSYARVVTTGTELRGRLLINCAGLYSDLVARQCGAEPGVQIVPFRGEYYFVRPESRHLVRSLIYPVPDPSLPFLGVHFTTNMNGSVEAGPNAVLALAREGYSRGRINIGEIAATLRYSGFRSLAKKYWRTGLYEYYRSFNKAAFVRSLQRLVPEIRATDLISGGAGVRAQAVAPNGTLLDDFHIVHTPNAIHVLNAPSPAATASLAIGKYLAELVRQRGI